MFDIGKERTDERQKILPEPGMNMFKIRQVMAAERGNTGIASCADIPFFRFPAVTESSCGITVSFGIWKPGNGVSCPAVAADEHEILSERGVTLELSLKLR